MSTETKVETEEKRRCLSIITRGLLKGKRCGDSSSEGGMFCSSCIIKGGLRDVLEGKEDCGGISNTGDRCKFKATKSLSRYSVCENHYYQWFAAYKADPEETQVE